MNNEYQNYITGYDHLFIQTKIPSVYYTELNDNLYTRCEKGFVIIKGKKSAIPKDVLAGPPIIKPYIPDLTN